MIVDLVQSMRIDSVRRFEDCPVRWSLAHTFVETQKQSLHAGSLDRSMLVSRFSCCGCCGGGGFEQHVPAPSAKRQTVLVVTHTCRCTVLVVTHTCRRTVLVVTHTCRRRELVLLARFRVVVLVSSGFDQGAVVLALVGRRVAHGQRLRQFLAISCCECREHVSICRYIFMCVCVFMCVCSCMPIYIHIYIYIYICIYTHGKKSLDRKRGGGLHAYMICMLAFTCLEHCIRARASPAPPPSFSGATPNTRAFSFLGPKRRAPKHSQNILVGGILRLLAKQQHLEGETYFEILV